MWLISKYQLSADDFGLNNNQSGHVDDHHEGPLTCLQILKLAYPEPGTGGRQVALLTRLIFFNRQCRQYDSVEVN
jgi:hypothetical protein